jgi:hypothetical protein
MQKVAVDPAEEQKKLLAGPVGNGGQGELKWR